MNERGEYVILKKGASGVLGEGQGVNLNMGRIQMEGPPPLGDGIEMGGHTIDDGDYVGNLWIVNKHKGNP